MIANPEINFVDASETSNAPQHPCDACKQSKLKCDQHRPTCDTCRKRDKLCNYSTADAYPDGRVRRFHRRSRNGCSHCKTRRVRCDEQKPVCGGCKRKRSENMCIYPIDHARSSRSRSPTIAPPLENVGLSQIVSQEQDLASMAAPDLSMTSLDYFSQLQTAQPTFNVNPANNAMSVWNPNTSTPSPSSLLASLFGPQAVDVFQSQPQPHAPPLSLNFEDILRNNSDPYSQTGGAQIDFMFNDTLTPKSPDVRWVNGFNWNGHDLSTLYERERLSREVGSAESTPISLNSDTAFNSTFSLVQPEYRDRPEHPSYLYQLQVLDQPDQLAQFFPSLEQRHQYRHFFHQTSRSLLVVPTTHAANPFLCHFSHLAFGAPAGQSIAHDAFRFALLSLASVDFGIKMDQSSVGDNAMYAMSDEQRSESFKRLRACSVAGIFKEEPNDVDLGMATVVALNIRDRLAGCQEWEQPLKIGQTIIEEAGGAAALINARPTADRRFLVEQMAILELIGHLTIWVSPKIFSWDNEWFRYHETGEGTDHIQAVYGWTREAAIYSARTMILCGEARDVDAMREAQPKPIYRQLKTIIESRMMSLVKRVKDFIPQGDLIRQNVMLGPLPREVTVAVLGIVGCMDLCLRTVIIMDDIKSAAVQAVVLGILDISEESMTRGHYAGLLLPLSWADGVAHGPTNKSRAKALLKSLKGHYHLNQALLELIINIDWALLNNLALHDWEAFLRKHGFYVPCF